MNNNQKPIILFDLDGTLIDSTEAILESFKFAYQDNDTICNKTDQNIKDTIGYPLEVMFEELGVAKNDIKNYVISYKKHYRKISNEKTVMLPYAQEAIKEAYSFATLGIVTTKTTQYSKVLLENKGVMHYFSTIIGFQEVQYPKPHPEPILKALENLGAKPTKDIYMIGDTKLDLIAARDANISSIGVLCGYGVEDELKLYSDKIVTNSLEAVNLVKKQFS